MPSDAAMRDKLAGQDYLTTVVEQDNARTSARVTGPMADMLPVGDGLLCAGRERLHARSGTDCTLGGFSEPRESAEDEK